MYCKDTRRIFVRFDCKFIRIYMVNITKETIANTTLNSHKTLKKIIIILCEICFLPKDSIVMKSGVINIQYIPI